MYISAKDNVNIKKLASLLSSSKARREQGEFAVERARNCIDVLCEGARGGAEVTALFYTKQAAEKYFDSAPETLAEKCGCKCFEISPELSQRISEGRSSQGVFAVVKMLHKSIEKLESGGKLLVLDGLQDPGNVGTLIRSALAFNFKDVYLVDCADAYSEKVIRSSAGTVLSARVHMVSFKDFSLNKEKIAKNLKEADILLSDYSDLTKN